jgi:hypothetical protein
VSSPDESTPGAGSDPPTSVPGPLGPEDQAHPDRDAQVDEVGNRFERSRTSRRESSDVEGNAWEAEATWEDDPVGPPAVDDASDDDDVDPIVHRGE